MPWRGAIELKEQSADLTEYHIIHNWLWLGSVASLAEAATLSRLPASFDHDGYKILCRPLLAGSAEIITLSE